MNPTNSTLLTLRRQTFRGANDVYARRRGPLFVPESSAINEAIEGFKPYDVTGVALGDDDRERLASRLSFYQEGQRFYDGEHWRFPVEDGETKVVFNFCKTIVDKAVDWFNANGWKCVCAEGNEQVAEFLNAVWRLNTRDRLTQRAIQYGAIKGEHYYYVTVRTHDRYGRPIPRRKWTVRIQVLDPAHVFPIWSDLEDRKMKACMIQFPVPGDDGSTELYSIWITPEEVVTYLDNRQISRIKNPIGEVNVVHCANLELSSSVFGQSDIESIIPLNEQYNATAHSIAKTIRYHAEPTTIIYGARASQLEKGAKSVWSGLPSPKEAKVENLTLQSDLKANYEYLGILFKQICRLSSTPEVVLDSYDVKVTSSSSAALELSFQPMVEKTRRRRVPHNEAIGEVNRLIMLFQMVVIGDNMFVLADDVEKFWDTGAEYTSPLPRDEKVELDTAIAKFNAGVWSRAEMIRQCSGVRNHQRLIVELLADKRADLAMTLEKAKAMAGERPNSVVAFLGSETLSEDLEGLQADIAALESLQKPNPIPNELKPPKPVVAPKKPLKVTVKKKPAAKPKAKAKK